VCNALRANNNWRASHALRGYKYPAFYILNLKNHFLKMKTDVFAQLRRNVVGSTTLRLPIEYRQLPHIFGKTFFGRRIDLLVVLDFRGRIHPK